MILLIFSGEEWLADIELVKDATKGPHVNSCRVGDAKNDLGSTIESTLDICVDLLVLEAA